MERIYMINQQNLSFTIVENDMSQNDISQNVFEIRITVDDNRILNRRDIINLTINNYVQNMSAEDQVCLCRLFLIIMFATVFLIIYEVNHKK